MKDSADLTIRHSQAPRARGGGLDASARRRFSPLNAPQRAAVEAFCTESRAWALRQAKRTYRHLPDDLREQAVDAAMRELRTGAPLSVDRRTLHAELAYELTAALRRVHIGWCLNQSAAMFRSEGVETPPSAPDGEALTHFVNEGLGGLERAVLQLEIGAGRDTRTARAALRLGPRQYARHREEGLSKLRDAITGTVAGHVCDQHVGAVVLAATGDRAAADALAGGATRCRACSREALGLRRLLHERLALAPWPLAIKPAGFLAAKAAAVAAGMGGKSASGLAAGFGGSSVGSGAGMVATVLAATAIATGGVAALTHDGSRPAAATHAAKAAPAAMVSTTTTRATSKPAAATRTAAPPRHHRAATTHRTRTRTAAHQTTSTAPATAQGAATTATPAAATTPAAVVKTTTQAVQKTTRDTVDQVQQTVDSVTQPLAPQLAQPVDDTVDQAQNTVDQVTSTVGGLLPAPK